MSGPGRARGGWNRALPAGLALAAVAGLGLPARAQPSATRPPPGYVQLGPPDQSEGRRILEEFRSQGIQGDYYLAFELRVLPRRGEEHVLHGSLWGSRNADGPVVRVEVPPAAPGAAGTRLLIQRGAHPALWRAGGAGVERLGVAALFSPIAGTDLTPFDLQMPFLYWPDMTYEGLARVFDRPTHQFLLRPPADFAAQHPQLTGVRVFLDTQYGALVQAELLGRGGKPLQAFHLLDLKEVGDQWLVKAVDFRDEATRNKTRLVVTAAALGLKFPPAVFDPADLAAPAPVPPDTVALVAP